MLHLLELLKRFVALYCIWEGLAAFAACRCSVKGVGVVYHNSENFQNRPSSGTPVIKYSDLELNCRKRMFCRPEHRPGVVPEHRRDILEHGSAERTDSLGGKDSQ